MGSRRAARGAGGVGLGAVAGRGGAGRVGRRGGFGAAGRADRPRPCDGRARMAIRLAPQRSQVRCRRALRRNQERAIWASRTGPRHSSSCRVADRAALHRAPRAAGRSTSAARSLTRNDRSRAIDQWASRPFRGRAHSGPDVRCLVGLRMANQWRSADRVHAKVAAPLTRVASTSVGKREATDGQDSQSADYGGKVDVVQEGRVDATEGLVSAPTRRRSAVGAHAAGFAPWLVTVPQSAQGGLTNLVFRVALLAACVALVLAPPAPAGRRSTRACGGR